MIDHDYGASDSQAPTLEDRNSMKYGDCSGIDHDLRSLYETYGGGETPVEIHRLAERLADAVEAEEAR